MKGSNDVISLNSVFRMGSDARYPASRSCSRSGHPANQGRISGTGRELPVGLRVQEVVKRSLTLARCSAATDQVSRQAVDRIIPKADIRRGPVPAARAVARHSVACNLLLKAVIRSFCRSSPLDPEESPISGELAPFGFLARCQSRRRWLPAPRSVTARSLPSQFAAQHRTIPTATPAAGS
jgi:hypothetical protein